MTSLKSQRSLERSDALILILATSLGLLATQAAFEGYDAFDAILPLYRIRGFRRWGNGSVPLFVAWSLGLLILQLRKASLRRRMHGPGIAPGIIILLFFLRSIINTILITIKFKFYQNPTIGHITILPRFLSSHLVEVSESAGLVIAATWFTLWVNRWWRPDPCWIDRAGRAMGTYWISMQITNTYFKLINIP